MTIGRTRRRFLARHQIILLIGLLLAIGLASILALAIQLRSINADLTELTAVAALLSSAAYEMEINVLAASLGVMKYLDHPHPDIRLRVQHEHADFGRFNTFYDRLARTDE
jgi:hypothetical protein